MEVIDKLLGYTQNLIEFLEFTINHKNKGYRLCFEGYRHV